MSSSSAVVIATFLCLSARNRLSAQLRARLPTAEALCHYLGCVENGQDCGHELPGDAGVGTFGGSEDHTAILLCRRAELRVYAFCPTALEAPLPLHKSHASPPPPPPPSGAGSFPVYCFVDGSSLPSSLPSSTPDPRVVGGQPIVPPRLSPFLAAVDGRHGLTKLESPCRLPAGTAVSRQCLGGV